MSTALFAKIKKCKRCPLCKSRIRAVTGNGALAPYFFIIGEAPGKNEELFDHVFVGKSGTLLRSLLKEINFPVKKTFFTNIIKCRPPNNRRPKKEEIEKCLPYLKEEIALFNPKVIITLGKTALKTVFKLYGIKEKATLKAIDKKTFTIHDKLLMATYHPAFALFNRKALKSLKKSLLRIKNGRRGI